MSKFKIFKKAFTLAEVLITLGIIGIVAAMTIPALITSYQQNVYLTQFKEVYSQLSQAYTNAAKDYGTADTWTSAQNAYNYLKPYFNISVDCQNTIGCMANAEYRDVKGGDCGYNYYNLVRYKFTLNNGAALLFDSATEVFIDTNGNKGPNQFGYDFFYLVLNNKNGAPYVSGVPSGGDITGWCTIGTPTGGWYNGGTCANWIIRHWNLDYLNRVISPAEWGP